MISIFSVIYLLRGSTFNENENKPVAFPALFQIVSSHGLPATGQDGRWSPADVDLFVPMFPEHGWHLSVIHLSLWSVQCFGPEWSKTNQRNVVISKKITSYYQLQWKSIIHCILHHLWYNCIAPVRPRLWNPRECRSAAPKNKKKSQTAEKK